jgi:cell shape-determining protein MreC
MAGREKEEEQLTEELQDRESERQRLKEEKKRLKAEKRGKTEGQGDFRTGGRTGW